MLDQCYTVWVVPVPMVPDPYPYPYQQFRSHTYTRTHDIRPVPVPVPMIWTHAGPVPVPMVPDLYPYPYSWTRTRTLTCTHTSYPHYKSDSHSSDYHRCMDKIDLTSCSNMSRVSVLSYSVSSNNKMKQWAFTLLDLVLWYIYYSIRPIIIAAYSILSFS